MYKFFKKYWQEILLAIFILIAGVLRFYHINRLEFFTYDQARDALFIKRMIVDHEFRLLGTQTSLPGMYLPPFYYYTILPVLWLFRLNPVGIDIYSAFFGVLTVPLIFFVSNKIFGKPAGIFSAGLFAVSPLVVELTRRAWNPNTLPFFILLTFYFVYRYFKEKQIKDFLLSFGFYGYSLSLHFGAWTLLPLFVGIWLFRLVQQIKLKGLRGMRDLGLLGGLGIFGFFVSPLLIFELRHNFFLTSQAKVFFFDGGHIGPTSGNFVESLTSSLVALFTILISGRIMVGYGAPLEFAGRLKEFFSSSWPISVVAQKPFSLSFQWWGTLIFIFILILSDWKIFLYIKGKKTNEFEFPALILIWIWILWGIFASRIYSGKFFFFYYLYLFPAPILLFGYLFKKIWEIKLFRLPALLAFLLIIYFHFHYTTVFRSGWRDINDLHRVANVISKNVKDNESFNIATIQRDLDRWDRNSVDYRYFVETSGGKRALDWEPKDYNNSNFLFVIDETGVTDVLKSNIMEIQEFGPKEIIGKWQAVENVIVYKLIKGEK